MGTVTPVGVARATEVNSGELRSVSEDELRAAVTQVLKNQSHLWRAANIARDAGTTAWLAGGAAASVVIYAHRKLERGESIPDDIHYYDVFSPGQDVDLAVDGDLDAVRRLNVGLTSDSSLKIRIQEKSAWDIITLRQHNGRGFVDNEDMYLQHSDSLSLGLVLMSTQPDDLADIRWAQNFEQGGENPFLQSILNKRIEYYYRDTHHQNSQAAIGRNPEIISVMRLINKAAKFSYTISPEQRERALTVVREFLAGNGRVDDYVTGRLNRIVRTMIVASDSSKYTLKLLRDFKVLKVLRHARLAPHLLSEAGALARTMVHAHSGLALGGYERVRVDQVPSLPDGTIFEGTTLHGGGRPPMMVFPSRLLHEPEVQQIYEIWKNRANGNNPTQVASELSRLAKQVSERVRVGAPGSAIIPLTDLQHSCKDCRDYSLVGHMLFSLAGIPSLMTSTSSHTKVYMEIGDRRFLLNTHNGSYENVNGNTASYFQSYWIRRGQDYTTPRTDYHRLIFDEFLRDPAKGLSADELGSLMRSEPEIFEKFLEARRTQISGIQDVKSLLQLASYHEVLEGRADDLVALATNRLIERLGDVASLTDEDWVTLRDHITLSEVPLPDSDLSLRMIDAVLSSEHRDGSVDIGFASDMLSNVREWGDADRKRAAVLMAASFANLDDIVDTGVNEMLEPYRQPSLEMLPYARGLKIRDGRRYFSSHDTLIEFYSDEGLSAELFYDFIRHDHLFDLNGRYCTAIGDLWKVLETKASSGNSLALEKLHRLYRYVALESDLRLDASNAEGIEGVIGNFLLRSPLANVEPYAEITKAFVFQRPEFIFDLINEDKGNVSTSRMLDLFKDYQPDIVGLSDVHEKILEKALKEYAADPQGLSDVLHRIFDFVSVDFRITAPRDERLVETIKQLPLDQIQRLMLMLDDIDPFRYRLTRALYPLHGDSIFALCDVSHSYLAKTYATGKLDPSRMQYLVKLITENGHLDLEKYFSPAEVARMDYDSLIVAWDWAQSPSTDTLKARRTLQFLRTFQNNPWLESDRLHDQVIDQLQDVMTDGPAQRRFPGLVKSFLARGSELSPLLASAVHGFNWTGTLGLASAQALWTRVSEQLSRTGRPASEPRAPSEANRLCEVYLRKLL
ncbi:MAG TPA: hypothetical protein VM901_03265 [Bdellovibrionota bacterium]|nr:hypothetical protein [Bdellovibrionota bacterium]